MTLPRCVPKPCILSNIRQYAFSHLSASWVVTRPDEKMRRRSIKGLTPLVSFLLGHTIAISETKQRRKTGHLGDSTGRGHVACSSHSPLQLYTCQAFASKSIFPLPKLWQTFWGSSALASQVEPLKNAIQQVSASL